MLGPVLARNGFSIRQDPTNFALIADRHEDDLVFDFRVFTKGDRLYADLTARFDETRGNRSIGGSCNIPIEMVENDLTKDVRLLRECARRTSNAIDNLAANTLRSDLAAAGYRFEPTADGWFMSLPVWDAEITVAYSGRTPDIVSIAVEYGGLEAGGVALAVREATHRAAEAALRFKQLAYDRVKALSKEWALQRQQRNENTA